MCYIVTDVSVHRIDNQISVDPVTAIKLKSIFKTRFIINIVAKTAGREYLVKFCNQSCSNCTAAINSDNSCRMTPLVIPKYHIETENELPLNHRNHIYHEIE